MTGHLYSLNAARASRTLGIYRCAVNFPSCHQRTTYAEEVERRSKDASEGLATNTSIVDFTAPQNVW